MFKMAKWTREQTTMLLELYKQYPHLYDNRNICYSDRNERQNTLLIIAKELEKIRPKTTVRDLKQKIRTIRTQYCVEKHKFHKSPSKDFYSPRLWCYDSLKFLDGVVSYDNFHNRKIENNQAPKLDRARGVKNNDVDKSYSEIQTIVTASEIKEQDMEHIEATLSQNSRSETPSSFQRSQEPKGYDVNGANSPTIHLAQKFVQRINKDKSSRNNAFAKFISEELDSIEDREILEDAKWAIQMAIRNALKQDRKRKNIQQNSSFQPIGNRLILSPSPSQSSSSACFHSGEVKQEMSEEEV